MFATEIEIKAFSKGLRREMKAAYPDAGSFNQVLEMVARAAGHESYGHMLAAVKTTPPVVELPVVAVDDIETGIAGSADAISYRLFNTAGELDLASDGVLLTGLFLSKLSGTVEDVPGTSYTDGARRIAGKLEIEHGGETNMDWDSSRTRKDARNVTLWQIEDDNDHIAEDFCVLVPEDFAADDVDDFYDEERIETFSVPVRPILVAAIHRYLTDKGLLAHAKAELSDRNSDSLARDLGKSARSALGKAQTAVGFALHLGELAALAKLV